MARSLARNYQLIHFSHCAGWEPLGNSGPIDRDACRKSAGADDSVIDEVVFFRQ